jgi:hypothetical protein
VLFRVAFVLCCCGVASACAVDTGAPRDPFIALTSDFDGFEAWPSVAIAEPFSFDGGHRVGTSRVFMLGELPPEGSPFAVGTILLKTVEDGDPTSWELHAMVKRGGDYNREGSAGWEWLDLALTPEREPVITWRGEGTPFDPGTYRTSAGETIACNACHGYAVSRDHVFSRALLTGAGL